MPDPSAWDRPRPRDVDYPGVSGKSHNQPATYRAEVRYANARWFTVGITPSVDLARKALRALEGSWDVVGHLPIETRIVKIPTHGSSPALPLELGGGEFLKIVRERA